MLRRVALAFAAVLLLAPPLHADPKPAAVHANAPALRKARALIDRMALDLERMTVEVEAAGADGARIRLIGERFRKQAEGMRTEGERLRKQLNASETQALETYARDKITPLTSRLMGAMMKAQGAAPRSVRPQFRPAEDGIAADTTPVRENVELAAAKARIDLLVAQLGKLTMEAQAAGADTGKLQAIEGRLRALLAQAHDDEHQAYRKVSADDRGDLRLYRDLQQDKVLRRLRAVLDRAGRPECPDLVRARGAVTAYAQELTRLQARVALTAHRAQELEGLRKQYKDLRRRDEQIEGLKVDLAQDELDELEDDVLVRLAPLQQGLESTLAEPSQAGVEDAEEPSR